MRNRILLLLLPLCAVPLAPPAAALSQTPGQSALPAPTQAIPLPVSTHAPADTPTTVPSAIIQTPGLRVFGPTLRERPNAGDLDASDPGVTLVQGTVCVDENGDGMCAPGEAPMREARVSTGDGRSLTLTDELGRYALRALAGSGLSVIPPAGYRALTSTLPVGPRTDFPLVADISPTTPSLNTSPLARISELLIYIIASALVVLLILTNLRVSGSIESLRRAQLAIAEQNRRADLTAWRVNDEQRIQHEWGSVAGQQIANLLGESIRINDQMGITGVATEPAPRFAVTDARGRKFIFTTSAASLRELGLIGWRDRVLRVTESSSLSLAQILWDYVATQSHTNIIVPRSSPWYLAVRDPTRASFDPLAALRRGWALRAIRRAVRHAGPWQPAAATVPAIPAIRVASTQTTERDFHPDAVRPARFAIQQVSVSPTALTEAVAPIRIDASRDDEV